MLNITAPSVLIFDATIRFGNHTIYQNLDLTLKGGLCTAILGQSGIGKSTLLKQLLNLRHPHPENQFVGHHHITFKPHLDASGAFAYIGQSDALLPWLNVLNNTLLGFKLRGNPISQQLVALAKQRLQQVGLADSFPLFPHQLSGGMKQRVLFARTLLEDRPIILLDEPFNALDTHLKLGLYALLNSLFEHKTVCIVTHDPLEAVLLADDIYIMEGSPVRLRHIPIPLAKQRNFNDPDVKNMHAELMNAIIPAATV